MRILGSQSPAIAALVGVVRRGWLIVPATVFVVVGVATALSVSQQALYQASTPVFLDTQGIGNTTASVQQSYREPGRVLATQADVAQIAPVRAEAIKAAGTGEGTAGLEAAAGTDADVLTFSGTADTPALAEKLSNSYAQAYRRYRAAQDTNALVRARKQAEAQLAEFRNDSKIRRTALFASLTETVQSLRTREFAQAGNTALGSTTAASQTQPKLVRNIVLGAILGIAFGLMLAVLKDALNTRVRTAADVEDSLGLPLIGRLPAPPKGLRDRMNLGMLAAPDASATEAYRILATNLEFANLDKGAHSILITSAIRAEGKSTTLANLAVVFARAGRRVVIVDLDLRRPALHRYFNIEEPAPGLTQVALGRGRLEDALVDIHTESMQPRLGGSNGGSSGRLEVLPSGPLPPNPSEFARSAALAEILHRLKDRADLVLIDAPPLLVVSDGMALVPRVDAVLVVAKLGAVRRPALVELRRVLEAAPISKLGFIVTDAAADRTFGSDYGYGYGSGYEGAPDKERLLVE
ncbi:MAG: polysaccharide biosynthesis tyrosine autokinase [Thermoleophilaceae bacterium]|nr:polysaccharide biosynthesis tyrosine autokinase [Thermoleophilaceae bacterium]